MIRTVISLYDQPQRPLRFESFINTGDDSQRADFAALADQQELFLLFYDEALAHRLSKRLATTAPQTVARILAAAEQFRAALPPEHVDFDVAKAAVLRATTL